MNYTKLVYIFENPIKLYNYTCILYMPSRIDLIHKMISEEDKRIILNTHYTYYSEVFKSATEKLGIRGIPLNIPSPPEPF